MKKTPQTLDKMISIVYTHYSLRNDDVLEK